MNTNQPRIVEWDITSEENARAQRALEIEEQVRASMPHENCFCAEKDREVAVKVKAIQDGALQKKHAVYAGVALAAFAMNEIANYVTDGASIEIDVAQLFTTNSTQVVRAVAGAIMGWNLVKSDLHGVGASKGNPKPVLGEY